MIVEFRGEYRWLSNFHLVKIDYEGLVFPSTEHAYQASKASTIQERVWIANAKTCGEAKRMGKEVNMWEGFEFVKKDVMYRVNKIKFQNPELKAKLLATGDQELIEGNTWGDTYWGVCNGEGFNHLGKILMKIREEIRNEN